MPRPQLRSARHDDRVEEDAIGSWPRIATGELRAAGDRELAERLLADPDVKDTLERLERRGEDPGARRRLLATAIRLTREMAPDVHDIMDECRRILGGEAPFETYVDPEAMFNAAAVAPEQGRLFLLLSSALLEAFEPDELRFVVGHELGHHLFEHHRIPVAVLLSGIAQIDLEMQVHELMTLMAPNYLQDTSDVAEAMRRLLFAGGVAVATASGTVTEQSLKALEQLLGVGSIPAKVNPDAIRADMPSRIDRVNRIVPPLRRAQVIRDLCVIACADGRLDEAQLAVIRETARAVSVDQTVIACSTHGSPAGSCGACANGNANVAPGARGSDNVASPRRRG